MAYRRGGKLLPFTASFLPSLIMFHLTLLLVRVYDRLIFRLRVKGRENLKRVGPAVLVSNHTLVVDPGVIAHALSPRRTYFTMLEDTACIPLLGTYVRLLGAIPIPDNPAALRTLEATLRSALNTIPFVHVFPEGECYLWNQQIKPFQPGAFYLACRLGLPILPLTIVLHERRLFGRRCFRLAGISLRIPPRITAVIGEPAYPGLLTSSEPAVRTRIRSGPRGAARPAPPTAVKAPSPKRAAAELSARLRRLMQETIDREGGSKTLYRGLMPRIAAQSG